MIGVDVGGTKTLFVLFDERFRVLEEIKERTPHGKDFDECLDDGVEALLKRAEKERIGVLCAGVGCAGRIDREKGIVLESPNIPHLTRYPLARRIAGRTATNVYVGNDVQMGLYGEHHLGAAAGLRHVIGVFFGTGIGGAAVIDGKLHLGARGAAGEVGNCLVSPMGPLAGSERQGVLDELISRVALAGDAASLAAKKGAPRLFKLAGADASRIHGGTIAASIAGGDEKVEELVRSRARMAGIALSGVVDFLNPEMVVLGGGLVDAMPALFLKEVGEGIRARTVPDVRESVRIAAAKLAGRAVAAGAAKMARDRLASQNE